MIRAIVVSSAYIAAQMLADVTSLKIVLFLGLSMDAGTFVYPITFTLRDLVHKTVGVRAARVLTSNAVSVPLDSLLFSWGAFGGVLPAAVVWDIVVSNVLVKGATTLISLPLIYAVPESVTAEADPVLTEVWGNEKDAAYDQGQRH